jgi:Secretion system C-terminal sorting domain
MKKHFLILLTFLLSLNLSAQTDSICTDFETPASFIKNLSNSWQIGSPNKAVFNSSYSSINSIVTDTANTYPINDTSVFYDVYAPGYISNYLGIYFPFRIEFDHRYDTDSLNDFGTIELSKDGGNTWINGLSNAFSYYWGQPMDNSHIFLGTNDTIYDSLVVTGNSNGWVHSTITKDLDSWLASTGWTMPDSIMVKFTFKSDSVNNSKDGWQIDNLCIKYLVPLGIGIEEIENKNSLNIYPNPFTSQTTIFFNEQQTNTSIKITDVLGQEIRTTNFTGRQLTIDKAEMKEGIYFVQTTDEQKHICNKKIIIQ